MTSKKREQVYKKYGGRCAYTGTPLKDDWQVDHIIPKEVLCMILLWELVPQHLLLKNMKDII
jgi:5-methylcytosine-specific restriction endonuclease McrA